MLTRLKQRLTVHFEKHIDEVKTVVVQRLSAAAQNNNTQIIGQRSVGVGVVSQTILLQS